MPGRVLLLLAVCFASGAPLRAPLAAAQEPPPPPKAAQPAARPPRQPPPELPSMQVDVPISAVPRLAAGTEIPLVLTRDVKVKMVHPGDTAEFALSRDLWYRDTLLAPRGTPVQVVVKRVERAKWLSRGSKLEFTIQNLHLLNGTVVPLHGEPNYHGGINSVSGVALSANAPGGDAGALVGGAAMLVGVFGLVAPGKTRDAKAGSRAYAQITEDFPLDIDSLRRSQPARDLAATTGKVQVVRGIWDRLKSRDLYCNGVPLARLAASRKYVAELKPGWYRFAINPKQPPVELYVVGGEVYTLLALPDSIELVDAEFSAAATEKFKFGPGLVPRTAEQMLSDAKPVDTADMYGDTTRCAPLAETLVPAAAPPGAAAIANGTPASTPHD